MASIERHTFGKEQVKGFFRASQNTEHRCGFAVGFSDNTPGFCGLV